MGKRKKRKRSPFVVVYTTHIYEEAHIVAGRLRSEGIDALVEREAVAGVIGLTLGTLGEVRVRVHGADYAEAMAILEDETTLDEDDINEQVDDDA